MNEALRFAESILTHFENVDDAAKLEAVQKAAGQVLLPLPPELLSFIWPRTPSN